VDWDRRGWKLKIEAETGPEENRKSSNQPALEKHRDDFVTPRAGHSSTWLCAQRRKKHGQRAIRGT
jgi:hypothetical protein